MDKSWTDAKRGFEEYFHGLDSFVEFVAHTACQGKNYRAWVFNGEFESTPTTTEGGSSCVHESLDQCGDFHGMLHDLHPMHDMALALMDEGPSVQQGPNGPSMQQPVEGPNDDAKKFYDRIKDVEKPLYKGCTKFSIFSVIVVLYHLKTLCGWTNKSFTLLLQVLHNLLPLDVKLPKDCYEAKKIITDLGLDY